MEPGSLAAYGPLRLLRAYAPARLRPSLVGAHVQQQGGGGGGGGQPGRVSQQRAESRPGLPLLDRAVAARRPRAPARQRAHLPGQAAVLA